MPDKLTGLCCWCGGPLPRNRRLACSRECKLAFVEHGTGPSRTQVLARRRHAESQPQGAQSVAEYLARGGTIYRERR